MNTVAIIQARMDSTRLPGKVLKMISGRPLLWHIVHRLQQCQQLDNIIIATTTKGADDAIAKFAAAHNIAVVRGSERNVLDRFLQAARQYDAELILRVCGDSPLIDPTTIDQCLATMKRSDADLWQPEPRGNATIHEGFTPISRRALEALARRGAHDPAVVEHVTAKVRDYVPDLKIAPFRFDARHAIEGSRTSVDTPADLSFINTLYQRLGAAAGEIDISAVVALLKSDPALLEINAHVHQKTANEATHKVLIRCDGGGTLGLGHVMRCLALASVLRDHFSVGIRFVVNPPASHDHSAIELIERYHFPVEPLSAAQITSGADEALALSALIQRHAPDGVIFDIRTDLPAQSLRQWREQGITTVCVDDPSERRLACDLVFFPPVPRVREMTWEGFSGTRHIGWQWILLGPSFTSPPSPPAPHERPRLLIMMGGADPARITLKAIKSLARVHAPVESHVVLGRACGFQEEAMALARELALPCQFHTDVINIAQLMASMDLAIATYGVTAYELAALGVPSLLLCHTPAHTRAGQQLEQQGIARSLGFHEAVTPATLATQMDELLINSALRETMSNNARALHIGNGAHNIAREIKSALSPQSSG